MNDAFKVRSLELEMVTRYFRLPTNPDASDCYWTTSDVLNYLQDKTRKQLGKKKMGMALQMMGFKLASKRFNGIPLKVYSLDKVFQDEEDKGKAEPPPDDGHEKPKEDLPF